MKFQYIHVSVYHSHSHCCWLKWLESRVLSGNPSCFNTSMLRLKLFLVVNVMAAVCFNTSMLRLKPIYPNIAIWIPQFQYIHVEVKAKVLETLRGAHPRFNTSHVEVKVIDEAYTLAQGKFQYI